MKDSLRFSFLFSLISTFKYFIKFCFQIFVNKKFPPFLTLIFLLSLPEIILADIVYLKDGKVYENVHILATSGAGTQIETATKETFVIAGNQILRLRYADNIVEPINILLKDGTLIEGFLIDQDSTIVTIRKVKEENREEIIQKKNIQQMSADKITVVYPEINIRVGGLYPLNSGGSRLGIGLTGFLGFYINPPFFKNSKIGIEVGYVYTKSTTNKDMLMHLIPAIVNLQYLINISGGNSMEFDLAPRIGAGGSYLIFIDGEGGIFSAMLPAFSGGVGLYMILVPRKFFINVFADYLGLLDGKSLMHSAMGTAAAQFRF